MAVDVRFYAPLGTLSLGELAKRSGADLHGNADLDITGISSAASGRQGDLGFLDGDGKAEPEISPDITALIVNSENEKFVPEGIGYLTTPLPRYVHGMAAASMFRMRHLDWSGPEAVSADASFHDSVRIGPGAVIGPGADIGEDSVIGPNAIIGPGVHIGRNCVIGAATSVYCALIGDHVSLMAGVRLGEGGFGVMPGPAGVEDAPHYGRVILQDHVSIGANTCIDRGVFDDTIVGERTKIDNLCQIAHNVVLGRSVLMAAFAGISGSVSVGDGCMFGGRIGIADHVKIGERVSLAASSGIFRDIDSGETWGGLPAKPIRQWMREVAWLQKNANPKKTN